MNTELKEETKREVGQVKWFNNKAGYGFVTMNKDDDKSDIFAHYSAIKVTGSQYKYLVQGEYVEFDLSTASSGEHQCQATNITGLGGGLLMCETRQLNRPRSQRTVENEESEFVKVQKKRTKK